MKTLFPNAEGVLKPETLKLLAGKLSQPMCSIVDGWAAQNPKRLKQLEASGELLKKAQAEQELETEAQQRAVEAEGQMPPLSSWELADVYGGASRII